MKNKRPLACSSFNVEGLLVSDFARLEKLMALVPSLRLLSRGSRLRYRVMDSDGFERTIEFERASIRFVFHFNGPISSAYNHNLSMFLALLVFADGSYKIMLSSIYGYMIDALRNSFGRVASNEESRAIERQAALLQALSASNRQLSRDIFNCKIIIGRSSASLSLYRSFCAQVIDRLSRGGANQRKTLAEALGVDESTLDSILMDLKGAAHHD